MLPAVDKHCVGPKGTQHTHAYAWLQIQWAEHALDDLRRARWRASKEQASSPIDSLTMEMTHFVVTLHAFVSERMLHVSWTQLLQVRTDGGTCRTTIPWLACICTTWRHV